MRPETIPVMVRVPGAASDPATVTIRDAWQEDHEALLALEGSAPHTGAALIQARTNFFARSDAYPVSRVLVAEQDHRLLGVVCVALGAVRVAGKPCEAGYICNVRVDPLRQAQGIGPLLLDAATQWLEEKGARYVTGLVKTSNLPSMKMITRRGWRTVERYDYLVLDLGRFASDRDAEVCRTNVWDDPWRGGSRLEPVALQHFVPQHLDLELFAPPRTGSYAGSWQATVCDGGAWVSIWDDRRRRGLDPLRFRAVKGFDVSLEGAGGFRAFSAIASALRDEGLRQLLLPLRLTHEGRQLLAPFTEDTGEFNFVVKEVNGADPLPPGPVYFDIRH
jgi:GNAT superfamily N-acetyltransferase